MIANLTGVSYSVPMDTALSVLIPDTYLQHGCLVRDLKSEGASGFSKYYIVGKEIPDLSTQQQSTESILPIICRFVL